MTSWRNSFRQAPKVLGPRQLGPAGNGLIPRPWPSNMDLQAPVGLSPHRILPWAYCWWASNPTWAHPADGAGVSSWAEMLGSGKALAQATGSVQPTYRAAQAAFNNRPCLSFDGGDLLNTGAFGATISQPLSVVTITRAADQAATRILYDGFASGHREALQMTLTTGVLSLIASAAGASTATITNTTPHIVGGYYNGASSKVILDSATAAVAGIGASDLTGFIVGANFTGGNFWLGDVAFAGIISGDVTTLAGWNAFLAWAKAYYAIA